MEDSRTLTELELEPITSEDEDRESVPAGYEVATYPADYTLEVLHQKWKADEVVIPKFQRQFVWTQSQASRLIESFLVGLPVPAVFLYSELESQKYLVIDGQQRLKSVFCYFEGCFGSEEQDKRKVFNLQGLHQESPFYEKKFEDLRAEDQRRLKNAVLRTFIVRQLAPDDDTSMYYIFERLNTGGTLLASQEIRNCIYRGRFIEFLEEINKLSCWRKILGKTEPDSRQRDIELLVRFFAMRDRAAYKKPMKDFLSRFTRKNRNASEEILQSSRQVFEQTCDAVIRSLGDKPFHIRSGLNAAVFDAVMVAFSEHLDEIPTNISVRYRDWVKSENCRLNTTQRTTDVGRVRERFRHAEQELFGQCADR